MQKMAVFNENRDARALSNEQAATESTIRYIEYRQSASKLQIKGLVQCARGVEWNLK